MDILILAVFVMLVLLLVLLGMIIKGLSERIDLQTEEINHKDFEIKYWQGLVGDLEKEKGEIWNKLGSVK